MLQCKWNKHCLHKIQCSLKISQQQHLIPVKASKIEVRKISHVLPMTMATKSSLKIASTGVNEVGLLFARMLKTTADRFILVVLSHIHGKVEAHFLAAFPIS